MVSQWRVLARVLTSSSYSIAVGESDEERFWDFAQLKKRKDWMPSRAAAKNAVEEVVGDGDVELV